MNRHERMLKQLTNIAIDTDHDSNYKLIASVVHKGDIISVGYNRKQTHPLQMRFNQNRKAISLHAEIDAIAKASKRLTLEEFKRASLYVARVRKMNGVWVRGLAKPCVNVCQPTIMAFNIDKIFWTENED